MEMMQWPKASRTPHSRLRQAAVLTELHHLQLLSPHAKNIVETVLVKRYSSLVLDTFQAPSTTIDSWI